MIKVVAKSKIKPECTEQYKTVVKELIEETRKEAGNISYTLNVSKSDEYLYAMIEVWEDQKSLDAHLASEHFRRIIPQLGPLTEGGSPLEIYEELI
ncbi:MAG: antibiotic biosynthesis monooxygenase [Oscillospiraceae bacterium]|nr:antibiotic biosynthesis monooxygenase [Oscillospiraceae bacterium]